jgi:2-polyprenyl-3-methyl-5-hydroxy-6-metoxy-1,4-benzoquinol methylase
MTSKEIARFIGKSIFWRRVGYILINMTTLREWYIKKRLNKILDAKNSDFKFLDAGSGIGQHALAVSNKYQKAKVDAIEQDSEQVADCIYFAQKTGQQNIKFFQGDLATIKSSKNDYDVMLCSSVLEHIQQDTKVMRLFHNSLKDDGYALIYVPQSEQRIFRSLKKTMQKMVEEAGDQFPHGHVRYYEPEELQQKLKSVGFEIVETVVTYGVFGRIAYDIVTTVQYSKYFKLLFPFYLILIHPFVLLIMLADYLIKNKKGNGLLVVAHKNSNSEYKFA